MRQEATKHVHYNWEKLKRKKKCLGKNKKQKALKIQWSK